MRRKGAGRPRQSARRRQKGRPAPTPTPTPRAGGGRAGCVTQQPRQQRPPPERQLRRRQRLPRRRVAQAESVARAADWVDLAQAGQRAQPHRREAQSLPRLRHKVHPHGRVQRHRGRGRGRVRGERLVWWAAGPGGCGCGGVRGCARRPRPLLLLSGRDELQRRELVPSHAADGVVEAVGGGKRGEDGAQEGRQRGRAGRRDDVPLPQRGQQPQVVCVGGAERGQAGGGRAAAEGPASGAGAAGGGGPRLESAARTSGSASSTAVWGGAARV